MAYLGKVIIIYLYHKGHVGYQELPLTEEDSAVISKQGSFMEEPPTYVKFLSLLPLYSLIIFRAKTRAVFAPPWASSQNHTTGRQVLVASPDFKATFSDLCSLRHLPSPLQDFLKIFPQTEGKRAQKSSNINQQGKL